MAVPSDTGRFMEGESHRGTALIALEALDCHEIANSLTEP
jgi:hypothetical protein